MLSSENSSIIEPLLDLGAWSIDSRWDEWLVPAKCTSYPGCQLLKWSTLERSFCRMTPVYQGQNQPFEQLPWSRLVGFQRLPWRLCPRLSSQWCFDPEQWEWGKESHGKQTCTHDQPVRSHITIIIIVCFRALNSFGFSFRPSLVGGIKL